MTEQEMMEELDEIWTFGHEPTDKQRDALHMAMNALEELKRYREIGTLEEVNRMQKYSALAKKHDTIGKVIESCVEYEKIGTVEECREARKKCEAKKVDIGGYSIFGWDDDGEPLWKEDYECSECGCGVEESYIYCPYCGQVLEWRT